MEVSSLIVNAFTYPPDSITSEIPNVSEYGKPTQGSQRPKVDEQEFHNTRQILVSPK
jgi:hypothetical protein